MSRKLKEIGFWVLSFTWGIVMALPGAITALILLLKGNRPFKVGPAVCFEVGSGWGGVNLGPFSFVEKGSGLDLITHEIGHSFQNIVWGPLFFIVIGLPSMLRCWLRGYRRPSDRVSYLAAVNILGLILTSVPLLILGLVFRSLLLELLCLIPLAYSLTLFTWQALEIKKYSEQKYDNDYDSVWFEGQATSWGKRFYYSE